MLRADNSTPQPPEPTNPEIGAPAPVAETAPAAPRTAAPARTAETSATDAAPMSEFEQLAQTEAEPGLLTEFYYFLRDNKKWWLIPMLLVMGFVTLLAMLVQLVPGAAPFIYQFF